MSSDLDCDGLTRNKYIDCLTQQLGEYELLKSMYPNRSDIIITEKSILSDINKFLYEKSEYVPNHLDFTLNLIVNELKLEVCINLPSCYPHEEPDIYVRCNQLNRHQESKLNAELSEFIRNNHMGEVCLYTAVSWLHDNIDTFCSPLANNTTAVEPDLTEKEDDCFVRLWIYSHHIYNKKKRDDISKKAKELNLNGFCLPGKPGIICIEGEHSSCQEWWRDIKSMCWQKINLRKTEILKSFESEKKFSNFEEIHFKNSTNNKTTNMGEFSKYMCKLGLSHIFSEIFGLCED